MLRWNLTGDTRLPNIWHVPCGACIWQSRHVGPAQGARVWCADSGKARQSRGGEAVSERGARM